MAASRRKGKWVGGIPALGYDVAPGGGQLVIKEEEPRPGSTQSTRDRRPHGGQQRVNERQLAEVTTRAEDAPRITRLMALAVKFEGLIQQGVVKDYAELARLGQVSRARITQIMNLLNLAPAIQEAIVFITAEASADHIPCATSVRTLNPESL